MFSFKKGKFCGKNSNSLLWGSTSHSSCGCWRCPSPWWEEGSAQSLSWFTWAGGDRAHEVCVGAGSTEVCKRLYVHRTASLRYGQTLCWYTSTGEKCKSVFNSFSWELGLLHHASLYWCAFISTWGRCRSVTILAYPKFSYDDQQSFAAVDRQKSSCHADSFIQTKHVPLLPFKRRTTCISMAVRPWSWEPLTARGPQAAAVLIKSKLQTWIRSRDKRKRRWKEETS